MKKTILLFLFLIISVVFTLTPVALNEDFIDYQVEQSKTYRTKFTLKKSNITEIKNDAFNNYPYTTIDLSGNTLTDSSGKTVTTLPVGPFQNKNLKKLRVLRLSNMQLEKIEKEMFKFFEKLEKLDLSDNKIENIPNGTFDKLVKNLKVLDLSGNPLDKKTVDYLYELRELRTEKIPDPVVPHLLSKTKFHLDVFFDQPGKILRILQVLNDITKKVKSKLTPNVLVDASLKSFSKETKKIIDKYPGVFKWSFQEIKAKLGDEKDAKKRKKSAREYDGHLTEKIKAYE